MVSLFQIDTNMTLREYRQTLFEEINRLDEVKEQSGKCWQAWVTLRKRQDYLQDLMIHIPDCDYEVFTDGTHLVSRHEEHLHDFAQTVGLKREWFQDVKDHPHYDITTKNKLKKVLEFGATKVDSKIVLLIAKNMIRDENL